MNHTHDDATIRPFTLAMTRFVAETYTKLTEVLEKIDSASSDDERAHLECERLRLMELRARILETALVREHYGGSVWLWANDRIQQAGFQNLLANRELSAFVMSIDIRRSTQLMLNATDPEAFATFIITLGKNLRQVIWDHYGIFEKFTGDGILACFPKEYSAGHNTARVVLDAATKCQEVFMESYALLRDQFQIVTKDTGVGVGVDFGRVYLARQLAGLTVVGRPVVYACRLSGTNSILFNHQAYRELVSCAGDEITCDEEEVTFKNENAALLAYNVNWKPNARDPRIEIQPHWERFFESLLSEQP